MRSQYVCMERQKTHAHQGHEAWSSVSDLEGMIWQEDLMNTYISLHVDQTEPVAYVVANDHHIGI
jgi:hypothetical protein